jgi:hypothetical protein
LPLFTTNRIFGITAHFMVIPPYPQEPVSEIARQRVENAVRHLLEGLRCSPEPAMHHAAAEVAARLELPVMPYAPEKP